MIVNSGYEAITTILNVCKKLFANGLSILCKKARKKIKMVTLFMLLLFILQNNYFVTCS